MDFKINSVGARTFRFGRVAALELNFGVQTFRFGRVARLESNLAVLDSVVSKAKALDSIAVLDSVASKAKALDSIAMWMALNIICRYCRFGAGVGVQTFRFGRAGYSFRP
jgi:hypothetical protein